MGGGGSAPEPVKPPARVEYKKEAPRGAVSKGKKRRPKGLYSASRRATQAGAGFGGQAKTLG